MTSAQKVRLERRRAELDAQFLKLCDRYRDLGWNYGCTSQHYSFDLRLVEVMAARYAGRLQLSGNDCACHIGGPCRPHRFGPGAEADVETAAPLPQDAAAPPAVPTWGPVIGEA